MTGSENQKFLCAWERFKKSLLETKPRDVIRFLFVAACIIVVYVQVQECTMRLRDPPVTTHSELLLNDTMHYPALTICREPPYKRELYKKFNFNEPHAASYPVISFWKFFPYDLYNISDFWNETVYNKSVFLNYGLMVYSNNVELQSSVHLTLGMCHTIRPKIPIPTLGRKAGYALTLEHDLYDYDSVVDDDPGWNIYFHEPREIFSENVNILSSRQDHVFLPVGEQVEISLDAYQFNMLKNCNAASNYTNSECQQNLWENEYVKPYVNCSGPWFPTMNLSECDEPNGMKDLIKITTLMNMKNSCLKSCRTTHYKTYIVKRSAFSSKKKLMSTAYIYFSSKTLIQMEERLSYDWNVFVADIGGSVGFLLGLSVIGVIDVLENIIKLIFARKKKKEKKEPLGLDTDNLWRYGSQYSVSKSSTVVAEFDRY